MEPVVHNSDSSALSYTYPAVAQFSYTSATSNEIASLWILDKQILQASVLIIRQQSGD